MRISYLKADTDVASLIAYIQRRYNNTYCVQAGASWTPTRGPFFTRIPAADSNAAVCVTTPTCNWDFDRSNSSCISGEWRGTNMCADCRYNYCKEVSFSHYSGTSSLSAAAFSFSRVHRISNFEFCRLPQRRWRLDQWRDILKFQMLFPQYHHSKCVHRSNELLSFDSHDFELQLLLLFPFDTTIYLQLLSQFQQSRFLDLHFLEMGSVFRALQVSSVFIVCRMVITIFFGCCSDRSIVREHPVWQLVVYGGMVQFGILQMHLRLLNKNVRKVTASIS